MSETFTDFSDMREPTDYYYLVAAQSPCRTIGTWGTATEPGSERPDAIPSASCP